MNGWRVWFAFESRPSVTMPGCTSEHYRGLYESCNRNMEEYNTWLDVLVEYRHLWGYA